jgi:hypothetical protein
MLGAVAAGTSHATLFRWLTHAATDHFLDYAHGHIYVARQRGGDDRLQHARRSPAVHEEVSGGVRPSRALPRGLGVVGVHRAGGRSVRCRDLRGRDPRAVARLLDAGIAPHRIALALSAAAAERLWRFDPDLELRDDVNEGWLHVTHALTHADAVRETMLHRPTAPALRSLFQSARFIHHMAPLDLPLERRPRLDSTPFDIPGEPQLLAAFRRHDPSPALGLCEAALAAGRPLADWLCRASMRDLATAPIFVQHHVKMSFAARRLFRAMREDVSFAPRADRVLIATARFLAHPLQERRIARSTLTARQFVVDGKRQHALLGYT